MSTLVGLHESPNRWEPPLTRPLDEAMWQAWVAKGRLQERRSTAARMKAVKWMSIMGLLAAAGLWSHLTPYEIVVRFIVAAGAIGVMAQALHARNYMVAAVFGTLALFYNPVGPVFSLAGDWQRALVVTSAFPFVASLAWPKERLAQ